ncbi:C-C motif chemokine 20 [Trichomycterus rosablanca]|uniref:C-C motif chemokine 20 n=1 Tax=Trichomycterus rosablanca TaxID=2290929 RepID=UPI002F358094
MALKGLAVLIFAGCWLMSTFAPLTDAYGPINYSCCKRYTRTPLPVGKIKGFALQSAQEVCRIDAVIFLTEENRKICASGQHEWVKRALKHLRSKIGKMTEQKENKVAKPALQNGTGA